MPKPIGMTFLQHNQWDDTLGPWPRKPCKPAGPRRIWSPDEQYMGALMSRQNAHKKWQSSIAR